MIKHSKMPPDDFICISAYIVKCIYIFSNFVVQLNLGLRDFKGMFRLFSNFKFIYSKYRNDQRKIELVSKLMYLTKVFFFLLGPLERRFTVFYFVISIPSSQFVTFFCLNTFFYLILLCQSFRWLVSLLKVIAIIKIFTSYLDSKRF